MTGAIVGSFVGIVSVIVLGKLFGMDEKLIFSLMPKSITTPFGIEVSSMLEEFPAITVEYYVTGIAGNVTAPLISKIFRVKHSVAVGIGNRSFKPCCWNSKAMEIGRNRRFYECTIHSICWNF